MKYLLLLFIVLGLIPSALAQTTCGKVKHQCLGYSQVEVSNAAGTVIIDTHSDAEFNITLTNS